MTERHQSAPLSSSASTLRGGCGIWLILYTHDSFAVASVSSVTGFGCCAHIFTTSRRMRTIFTPSLTGMISTRSPLLRMASMVDRAAASIIVIINHRAAASGTAADGVGDLVVGLLVPVVLILLELVGDGGGDGFLRVLHQVDNAVENVLRHA